MENEETEESLVFFVITPQTSETVSKYQPKWKKLLRGKESDLDSPKEIY